MYIIPLWVTSESSLWQWVNNQIPPTLPTAAEFSHPAVTHSWCSDETSQGIWITYRTTLNMVISRKNGCISFTSRNRQSVTLSPWALAVKWLTFLIRLNRWSCAVVCWILAWCSISNEDMDFVPCAVSHLDILWLSSTLITQQPSDLWLCCLTLGLGPFSSSCFHLWGVSTPLCNPQLVGHEYKQTYPSF